MKSLQQSRSDPKYKRQVRHRTRIDIVLLCLAIQVYSVFKDKQKRYFRHRQVDKRTYTIYVRIVHQRSALTRPYMDR